MNQKQFDLVALGEALVEFNHVGGSHYEVGVAGDAMNSLFYASRLGLECSFLSAIGSDPFTYLIDAALVSEGIDASHAYSFDDRPNGIYYVHTDAGGKPSFYFLRKGSAATQLLRRIDIAVLAEHIRSSRAFLFSAIPLAVMEDSTKMLDLIEMVAGETMICFDTNVRRSLWPDLELLRDWITNLAYLVDHLFVTDDDHAAVYPAISEADALEHYRSLGYASVVFRRGKQATLYSDASGSGEVPTATAPVVDTTGAGDSFNAGFISAALEGRSIRECVTMGNATAACAIQARGGRAMSFSREKALQYYTEIISATNVR